MSDGIDEAASVFAEQLSGKKSAPAGKSDARETSAPESLFESMGDYTDNSEGDADGDDVDDGEDAGDFSAEELRALGIDPNATEDEGEEEEEGKKAGEEDEDEDGDGELNLSAKVEVTVDGQPVEVTVGEALNGYIRMETFHRRLNQVNEAKNVVRAAAQEVMEARNKYAELLAEAEDQLKALLPAEPNWDEMFQKNPAQAREYQKQYQAYQSRLAEISSKRKAALEENNQQAGQELAEYVSAEYTKFIADGNFKSEQEVAQEVNAMRQLAIAVGFSDEEVSQVYDSRMLKVLSMASKYHRLVQNRPKPVKKGPTSVAPGAGKKSTAPKGMDRAQRSLRKTGRVEDAANVFAHILRGK